MRLNPVDLQKVQALRGVTTPEGVLSVYLPIEPGRGITHGHAPRLLDILKTLDSAGHGEARSRVEAESERVLSYVRNDYIPHGETLAVFSSAPASLWAAIDLDHAVPGLARFGSGPYLAPIDALLEDYPPVMAVLSDHNEARFVRITLGELADTIRITGDAPGRQRQGGWSAFRFERDRVRHIDMFHKRIVEALEDLQQDAPFRYVVLGGTDETTHALAAALTPDLRTKLAGTFRLELFATDSQVVDRARPLIDAAERAEELALVRSIIDTALAGGPAALGTDETLQTLREGRVHQLVVASGVQASPAGDLALQLAEETDALTEIAHGEAEALLEPYNGLGARLRF